MKLSATSIEKRISDSFRLTNQRLILGLAEKKATMQENLELLQQSLPQPCKKT